MGCLHGVLQRFTQLQALAPDKLIERLAGHVLHHDEVGATFGP
jgi:hypothetical protein